MSAAALVPTGVQKIYMASTVKYGTAAPKRLVKYWGYVTKATQNDWVVIDTYCQSTGDLVSFRGNTIDSSGDGVPETMTYTASGTKLTLTSATVGTTYFEVVYAQA